MNTLDIQYQKLLLDIIHNGVEKKDRTGTGTISVFGRQIRHKMSEGFPLLTTKKMAWKSIVTELLWFLRGDTNIKYLVDNDCHIWDGDAYKNYEKEFEKGNAPGRTSLVQRVDGKESARKLSMEDFITLIKTDDEFAKKWGELGPIYGAQWRSWKQWHVKNYVGGNIQIDQIANLINELKTNPDSRRLMVSAWNVGELDLMVLPPCHYGFQVYTRELSEDERYELCASQKSKMTAISEDDYIKYNIPTRAISLMWNQRSVDVPLGLPFNIASYGLLLEIIAKEVDMVPDELIGNLGDCHIYANQIDGVKEQIGRDYTLDERIDIASKDPNFDPFDFGVGIKASDESIHKVCDLYEVPKRTREPFELPTLKHMKTDAFYKSLSEEPSLYGHLDSKDFTIENYQSHPAIKIPLSN